MGLILEIYIYNLFTRNTLVNEGFCMKRRVMIKVIGCFLREECKL